MRVRSFKTEAIVLKRFNYGEADRILTLLTKREGKMTVIAKGVRKPSSRKRGHVELFNHFSAHIANGKGMGILIEASTINDFQVTNSQTDFWGFIMYAYQYAELIDRLIPEYERNEEVFDLLSKTLQFLNPKIKSSQLKAIDGYFKNRLIRLLGFWPSDRSTPVDIDQYIDSILEKPLKTRKMWDSVVLNKSL